MRKLIANVLIISMIAATIMTGIPAVKAEPVSAQSNAEMRGVWVSVFDFSKLGLKTNSEKTFRNNVTAFLKDARENDINTIFFHVRAFDDAIYPSKVFKRSQYISSTSSYDPLKILVEETHKQNMEFHAWMNPYRATYDYFLDPSLPQVTNRIVGAVNEVLAYGVDGIHFDDYFYNAAVGYKDTDNQVTINKSQLPSAVDKRNYVNTMIKTVRKTVKTYDKEVAFGVSPQGNIENCLAIGADVKTWLSRDGYVDYVMPQIYWTDQWSSSGTTKMFSGRLSAWNALNKNEMPLYVGLALYRTGISYKDDPGWKKKSTNLREQVALMRDNDWSGYVLFSAADLSRDSAQEELKNLRDSYETITVPETPTLNVEPGISVLKLSWNKVDKATGYQIFRSQEKDGTYQKLKTCGADTVSYTDATVVEGQAYFYKIRAYKTGEEKNYYSPLSSPVSAVLKQTTPQVAVSYNGYNSLKVSWNQIKGAVGYQIYQATSKDGTYKAVKTVKSSITMTYPVTGLSAGKTYYYKVRAYFRNEAGKTEYGGFSQPTSKAPRPDAPVLTAKASGTKSELSWNRVSGAGGYVIYRAKSAEAYKRIKVLTSSSKTKYGDGKLEKGSYQYKGRAFRTVSGKRIYSGYSKVSTVIIK